MAAERSQAYWTDLVREQCRLPAETEWVEFKRNLGKPDEIGEYISALANSAALLGRDNAYLIWGVADEAHDIVGTDFRPAAAKVGNENLENWLSRLLEPQIDFRFHTLDIDGKAVVVLEIGAAFRYPACFKQEAYIRIGSCKKRLRDHKEKERTLWRILDRRSFETGLALEHAAAEKVLLLLDHSAFFALLETPQPDGHAAILDRLAASGLILPCDAGGWNITNLGAVLFARNLEDFPTLRRKALRIIQYSGRGRLETLREEVRSCGYAAGFAETVNHIMAWTPAREVVGPALRRATFMFPVQAVRELVANALIHQDFFISGAGPMVEIFDERMEISNPGAPLVDTRRFVDSQTRSRNESLAYLMRLCRICEERGSGIDKVVEAVEKLQLPAPRFDALENGTRAVLFAHKPLSGMEREERVRACYLHACLKWVTGDFLTNASLRERFGIDVKNKAAVSRYIREALAEGVIQPFASAAPKSQMKYMPFWA